MDLSGLFCYSFPCDAGVPSGFLKGAYFLKLGGRVRNLLEIASSKESFKAT
jgi:hypothetical protein